MNQWYTFRITLMDTHNFKRGEAALTIAIIVIFLGSLAWYLVTVTHRGVEQRRVLELRSLSDLVTIYEIHENEYPHDVIGLGRWCLVGHEYRGGVCLGELVEKKYVDSLPVSPNENPYYYQVVRGIPRVGTPINETFITIASQNTCYGNLGERMWCQRVRR